MQPFRYQCYGRIYLILLPFEIVYRIIKLLVKLGLNIYVFVAGVLGFVAICIHSSGFGFDFTVRTMVDIVTNFVKGF